MIPRFSVLYLVALLLLELGQSQELNKVEPGVDDNDDVTIEDSDIPNDKVKNSIIKAFGNKTNFVIFLIAVAAYVSIMVSLAAYFAKKYCMTDSLDNKLNETNNNKENLNKKKRNKRKHLKKLKIKGSSNYINKKLNVVIPQLSPVIDASEREDFTDVDNDETLPLTQNAFGNSGFSLNHGGYTGIIIDV